MGGLALEPNWKSERARVASLTRSREPDDPDLVNARRAMRAAKLVEHIRRVLSEEPRLTDEQRQHLITAVNGGVR